MGTFQLASVLGPALGGLLIYWFRLPAIVYLCDVVAMLWFLAMISRIERPAAVVSQSAVTLQSLTAGIGFVWQNKVLLVRDGSEYVRRAAGWGDGPGAGLRQVDSGMRSERPGVDASRAGAGRTGHVRAVPHRPPIAHAGRRCLLSVAGFGLCMVAFGFSRSLPLSLAALCLSGAMDNISVVVRHTLVQLLTPDEMARPRFGGERHVYWNFERIGFIRVGAGGPLQFADIFRRERRTGDTGRRGLDYRGHATVTPLRAIGWG